MANTSYYFPPYTAGITFHRFDVIQGVTSSDTTYYYSTIPNNVGNSPSGNFIYQVTSYSRNDDVTTCNYTYTGATGPFITAGSLIGVTQMTVNTSVNYTGMATAGGSGWFSFINPGWSATQSAAGFVTTFVNPAWTTGFFFVPGYQSEVDSQQNVITAEFEPGYSQRQAASINSNVDQWQLLFENRSNREARAIRNYTQDKAGVQPFQIMVPVSQLDNQPTQKYVTTQGAKVVFKSFDINDITVQVKRVFDL